MRKDEITMERFNGGWRCIAEFRGRLVVGDYYYYGKEEASRRFRSNPPCNND